VVDLAETCSILILISARYIYIDTMDKLRIAVTGGSGRIGSRVVRHLWELGHTVYNVDQRAPRDSTA